MKPPILRYGTALLFCVFFCAQAISQKTTVGPAPSWITVNTYNPDESFGEQDAEDGYLDLAFERQISIAPYGVYIKKAMKVLTQSGIENISKVSVNYDPTYQQLVFHTIRIIRGTESINQLNQSKIKTIQQEKGIDKNLYDGSLTAMLILEDLRKGDVVEYSYTIKGDNPVFKGRISETFDFDYMVPVSSIYYKLITPANRSLTIKYSGNETKPEVSQKGNDNIYEWKLSHVPALRIQDNIPGWYSPFSTVMLSEYKNWQEVNDWALQLFPGQKNLSAPLKKKIAEIQSLHTTIEEQVGAALTFVQDEVRYMGIEVGANSHQPAHPDKIFAQRYGDCKDKSYLLCTMLKALGVEAYPVLINTYSKKDIENWAPSADVFDHTTVKAIVNGKEHWFDPTISYQRGRLDMISYPNYQVGLVIAPGTTGLSKINTKEPGKVEIEEEFDIKDMNGDAKLTVTTHYSGTFADDVRNIFHASSRYEILKNYREYYSSFHEDIKGDSLGYTDDEKTGIFTVKEYYSIEHLWELKEGQKKAVFSPYIILGLLKKPSDTKRKMPFAMSYPLRYREQVIIHTPTPWTIEESKDYVDTDPFKLKATFDQASGAVILTYDYESLQDFVAADKTQEYLDAVNAVENRFSYHLTDYAGVKPASAYKANGNTNRNIVVSLIGVLAFGGIVWFLTRRR